MPQSSDMFFGGLISKGIQFKELEEFVIKYDFKILSLMLYHFDASNILITNVIFPNLKKIVLINQNYSTQVGFKNDTNYFGLNGPNDVLFSPVDKNQFEISIKGQWNILSSSKVYVRNCI